MANNNQQDISLARFLGRDCGCMPHSGPALLKQIKGDDRVVLYSMQNGHADNFSGLFWALLMLFTIALVFMLVLASSVVAVAGKEAGRVALVILAIAAGFWVLRYILKHYREQTFVRWRFEKYLDRYRRELAIEASGYNKNTRQIETILERIPLSHMSLQVRTMQVSDSSLTTTCLILVLNEDVKSTYTASQFDPETGLYMSSESFFYEHQIKPGADLLAIGNSLSQVFGLTFDDRVAIPSLAGQDSPSRKQRRRERNKVIDSEKKTPRRKLRRDK